MPSTRQPGPQQGRRRIRDVFRGRPAGIDQPLPRKDRRGWRRPDKVVVGFDGSKSSDEVTLVAVPADGERPKRVRQQRLKRRGQRELAIQLREWRQKRAAAAERRRKAAAKKPQGPRGSDRVPARLQVAPPPPVWVHQHEPAQVGGRWVKGTPYRNPARVAKLEKSGRLRADHRQDGGR